MRNAPVVVGLSGAVFLGMHALDRNGNEQLRSWTSPELAGLLETANRLGGPEVNAPVAGLFLVSLLTPSRRFQDAAFTSLEALALAGGLSYALKYTFGRARPRHENHPLRFEPFSGQSSFPSGHATTAFAIVTPWLMYYRGPLALALSGVAVGTAIARVHRDKHWVSDSLAGAALGFAVGRSLALRHGARSQPSHRRWSWSPTPRGLTVTRSL